MNCPVCGHDKFGFRPILWPSLVENWGLTEAEATYIERQQGVHCLGCHCNLRAMALGQAMKRAIGVYAGVALGASLRDGWIHDSFAHKTMLEVNEAGALAPLLAQIPGHVRGSWPVVDLRALPYPDESFDVVVHSDTLEHVADTRHEEWNDADLVQVLVKPGVEWALRECHRVLRPGGALCFTVPTLVGKMTRPSPGPGKAPTYHGPDGEESLRVHTEFGADVWTFCLAAGFSRVEFTCIEWPAGLAITAWK